jgi:hypothetical protein
LEHINSDEFEFKEVGSSRHRDIYPFLNAEAMPPPSPIFVDIPLASLIAIPFVSLFHRD